MWRLVSYFSLTLLLALCACFVDYAFVIVVIKESTTTTISLSIGRPELTANGGGVSDRGVAGWRGTVPASPLRLVAALVGRQPDAVADAGHVVGVEPTQTELRRRQLGRRARRMTGRVRHTATPVTDAVGTLPPVILESVRWRLLLTAAHTNARCILHSLHFLP